MEVSTVTFFTNHGPIKLEIWDTAGQEKLGGLREGYYIGSHAAILMFDVTARITYKNIPRWYKDISRICESIPIVLVGNKVDQKERIVKARQITFHRKRNLQYFDISAKSNFQYEKPFLWIIRALVGDPNLYLTEVCVLEAPQLTMGKEQIEALKKEWDEAENAVLPDCEDEDFK